MRFFRHPPYVYGYFQPLPDLSDAPRIPKKLRVNTLFLTLPLEDRGQNDPGLYFGGMKADSAPWGQGFIPLSKALEGQEKC